MARRYEKLLSPIRVGDTMLKNRMLSSNSSPHFLQGPENYPAEGTLAFLTQIAKNGAAIVTYNEWSRPAAPKPKDGKDVPIAEHTSKYEHPGDMEHMQNYDLTVPAVENYFSQLADDIHFYGSKLLVNCNVRMPKGYSINGGMTTARANEPAVMSKMLPKEMMPEVMDAFIERLRRYVIMGYDGWSTRLDLMFMQPYDEPRQDEFGGEVENRARFYLMLCERIKKEFGPNFIIEGVLAGEQPLGYNGEKKNGYHLEDTVRFAKAADGIVDILQIREKDVAKSHPLGYNSIEGVYPSVEYAAAVKAATKHIIVAPIGGFQNPEHMEKFLGEGKCDMFGMARAFHCDPEYGKKLKEGRGEDIVPCLRCNKCHGTMLIKQDPWLSVCSVNPYLGNDHKLHRLIPPAGPSKKVAVIGGGPAGMKAALVSCERGHEVTLYERTDVLGGQMLHSDSFSFKWPVRNFKNYLIRQIEKSGIRVCMNTEPDIASLRAEGYDALIAATGAAAQIPRSISGAQGLLTCVDIFGKEAQLGRKVIIVGGSEVGVETGMYLAENGHDVTILSRQDELAHNASHLHYITMAYFEPKPEGGGILRAAWEKYPNLRGILNVTTLSVRDSKIVTYRNEAGEEMQIEGDDVIICGGMKPRLEEAMAYAQAADDFYIAGDCNGAGNLQRCMRDALGKAVQI